MDGRDFDNLTRGATALRSRRGLAPALGGMLAALGVPVLAHLAADDAGAKKKKKKKRKKCPRGKTRCSLTQCVDTRSNPIHCGACGNSCRPDEACRVNLCLTCEPTSCSIALTESCGSGFPCILQTGTNGTTICADSDNSNCGCQEDDDCDLITGPGSVCVLNEEFPECSWGACVPPCGSP